MDPPAAELEHAKHVKYWLRCLRTLLPTEYTSNDSNRMILAFFILSALDVLGVLQQHTQPAEREQYIQWVYDSQHVKGGFCGSPPPPPPSTEQSSSGSARHWEPSTLPSTYFALVNLAILGDDLGRVRKVEGLDWLRRLQRKDGSFGEMLGEDDDNGGRRDVRYCYWAAGVRWILRDPTHEEVEDIDVDALLGFVRSSKTYDHGFSESPFHEAHAGHSYCAISALSFLDRLPSSATSSQPDSSTSPAATSFSPVTTISSLEGTVRWLVSRQVAAEPDDEEQQQNGLHLSALHIGVPPFNPTSPVFHTQQHHEAALEQGEALHMAGPSHAAFHGAPSPHHPSADQDSTAPTEEARSDARPESPLIAGFSGRHNKLADTCYCFWVCGSLCILNRLSITNTAANRLFLLQKTQHRVGGFGKLPGDVPDVLHSYLGLAALSIMGEAGLKPLDPTACITQEAKGHIEKIRSEIGKADMRGT